jgi:hypothetical protein
LKILDYHPTFHHIKIEKILKKRGKNGLDTRVACLLMQATRTVA